MGSIQNGGVPPVLTFYRPERLPTPSDTSLFRRALEELAPGESFGDLDTDLQCRVLARAQALKDEAGR